MLFLPDPFCHHSVWSKGEHMDGITDNWILSFESCNGMIENSKSTNYNANILLA